MPNLNKVMLIGNLTRDPESRAAGKSTVVAFSLAVNRKWKNEAGVEQEEVTYADIEAWGKQGETIAKYVTKGRPLFVEGRLKLDSWEDRTTKEKRSKMKIVLENFQFLSSGKAENGAAAPGGAAAAPRAAAPAPKAAVAAAGGADEEVPF